MLPASMPASVLAWVLVDEALRLASYRHVTAFVDLIQMSMIDRFGTSPAPFRPSRVVTTFSRRGLRPSRVKVGSAFVIAEAVDPYLFHCLFM